MAITREELDALVACLEKEAERSPGAYRFRVFWLAVLGYAYIFLVLVVLLGLVGLLVLALVAMSGRGGYFIGKMGFGVLVLVYIILRALWVRIPGPEGLVLRPGQVGTLFRVVEEISRALKGPKFHQILLTGEFNAFVAQVPRLGVFGWQKNYLAVGLPLIQALSPEQFRAVLAHEFGHLSGAHGRFSSWIYRIRQTWYQLMETLQQQQHWGSFIFHRFFRWYVPFFGAYSFVLARAHEYEADRCAVELAGAQQAADALINTTVKGSFLGEAFWPALYRRADRETDPPFSLYTEIEQALRSDIGPQEASRWLQKALLSKTGSEDTHPSLADRLAAMGQEARLPGPVEQTAAQYYLGDALSGLTESLSHAWREAMAESWRERYRYVQESQQRLKGLDAKTLTGPLTLEEAWQRAAWTEEFQGSEAALPLYQEILETNPGHAESHFALGRIYLTQRNAEGIEHIEKAMQLETDAILSGCELIYNFMMAQGEEAKAREYYNRASQHAERLERAGAERSRLGFKDTYLYHDLPEARVAHLKEQIARYPQIAQGYLARKQVQYFPEKPLYVLGVVVRRPWYKLHSEKEDALFAQKVAQEITFPGETFVLVLNGPNSKLKKIMQKIPGSLIYRK